MERLVPEETLWRISRESEFAWERLMVATKEHIEPSAKRKFVNTGMLDR
jgi:hypothetical protein